ncbi:hypothetical protein M0P48_02215 [Candidatus Gracilibacteria bacterium]|nr:hypothetical protein [Candidatus Gracilibacteria bacterium]
MHRFRLIEKFSVKEHRFLNDVGSPSGAPAAAPAAAPAKPSDAPVAAEVVPKRDQDLPKLQAELTEKLTEPSEVVVLKKYFEEANKIKDEVFKAAGPISSANFDGEKERINKEIYAAYKKVNADFSGLKTVFGIKEEKEGDFNTDLLAIVSSALANSFINKAKEDTKYIDAFLQNENGKQFAAGRIEATFSYANNTASTKVTGGEAYDKAYAEFVKTQPKDAVPAGATAPVEGQKPVEVDPPLTTDAEKIEYMANTKVGKLLAFIGVDFAKVLNKTSPIVAAIFVALGFGPKLGIDSSFLNDLPEPARKVVTQFAASEYGYEKHKAEAAKVPEATTEATSAKAPEYEQFNEDSFTKIVKEKKALDQSKAGIKIDKEFVLSGAHPAKVVTNLNDGGEIVLDGGTAGAKLIVNGKEVVAEKDKVVRLGKETVDADIKSKNGIAILTGTIPAGVVFNNKCKFSEQEEAQAVA